MPTRRHPTAPSRRLNSNSSASASVSVTTTALPPPTGIRLTLIVPHHHFAAFHRTVSEREKESERRRERGTDGSDTQDGVPPAPNVHHTPQPPRRRAPSTEVVKELMGGSGAPEKRVIHTRAERENQHTPEPVMTVELGVTASRSYASAATAFLAVAGPADGRDSRGPSMSPSPTPHGPADSYVSAHPKAYPRGYKPQFVSKPSSSPPLQPMPSSMTTAPAVAAPATADAAAAVLPPTAVPKFGVGGTAVGGGRGGRGGRGRRGGRGGGAKELGRVSSARYTSGQRTNPTDEYLRAQPHFQGTARNVQVQEAYITPQSINVTATTPADTRVISNPSEAYSYALLQAHALTTRLGPHMPGMDVGIGMDPDLDFDDGTHLHSHMMTASVGGKRRSQQAYMPRARKVSTRRWPSLLSRAVIKHIRSATNAPCFCNSHPPTSIITHHASRFTLHASTLRSCPNRSEARPNGRQLHDLEASRSTISSASRHHRSPRHHSCRVLLMPTIKVTRATEETTEATTAAMMCSTCLTTASTLKAGAGGANSTVAVVMTSKTTAIRIAPAMAAAPVAPASTAVESEATSIAIMAPAGARVRVRRAGGSRRCWTTSRALLRCRFQQEDSHRQGRSHGLHHHKSAGVAWRARAMGQGLAATQAPTVLALATRTRAPNIRAHTSRSKSKSKSMGMGTGRSPRARHHPKRHHLRVPTRAPALI